MPLAPKPSTPSIQPEQVLATATAAVGIIAQFVPLDEEAKQGVAQLATTTVISLTAGGAAVRLGRQRWWKNFQIDVDGDPATPPTLNKKLLAVFAGTVLIAVGSLAALIVVLVT